MAQNFLDFKYLNNNFSNIRSEFFWDVAVRDNGFNPRSALDHLKTTSNVIDPTRMNNTSIVTNYSQKEYDLIKDAADVMGVTVETFVARSAYQEAKFVAEREEWAEEAST